MSNLKLARPYFQRPGERKYILGFGAHGVIGTHHINGTRHEITHTVAGVTRVSIYYTGETWIYDDAIIYRTRRGNGKAGSKLGVRYKEQRPYKVAWPNGNPAAAAARTAFATAVLNWQTVLTEEEKNSYYIRATRAMHMSGYNLYIREYMLANA